MSTAGAAPRLSHNRDFLLLWTGAGLSALGARATAIGNTLLVLWATDSATLAGLVGFAALLPALLLQLPAGAYIDRWDHRRVMMVTAAGRVLAVASVAIAVALGEFSVWHVVVAAFVDGALGVFYTLAERAAIPLVVGRERIASATAANEARARAASLLGQPAGTVLFEAQRWLPFGGTALAHLASLVAASLLSRGERRPPRRPEPVTRQIREGLAFVWGQTYIRRALGLLAASNALFQVLILAIVVIVDDNGGSPTDLGLILVANGVAGVLGALSSAALLARWGIRAIIIGVNVVWAALLPVVALTTDFVAIGALYAAIVFAAGVGNVAGVAYQTRVTPARMQGRSASVAMLLAVGASALGALGAGFLLDAVGTRTALIWTSAGMVVVAVLSICAFGGRAAAEALSSSEPDRTTVGKEKS